MIWHTELGAMKTAVAGAVAANCGEANLIHCGPPQPAALCTSRNHTTLVTSALPPATLIPTLRLQGLQTGQVRSCSTRAIVRCRTPRDTQRLNVPKEKRVPQSRPIGYKQRLPTTGTPPPGRASR